MDWKNQKLYFFYKKIIVTIELTFNLSGAIAGNPFQIDREVLAQNLGFPHASFNSIDSIQSRDFVCKFFSG